MAILCVPGENEAFKLIFMFHADIYQSWAECVQRKASNCTLYSRIIPISHKIPGSADGEKEIYNGSAWTVGTIHSAKITHRQGQNFSRKNVDECFVMHWLSQVSSFGIHYSLLLLLAKSEGFCILAKIAQYYHGYCACR